MYGDFSLNLKTKYGSLLKMAETLKLLKLYDESL